MLASDLMARARIVLQDEDSVRWPLAELSDWINDGLREISRQAPSAFARTDDLVLVAGVKQALPDAYTRMLRPIVNAPFEGADRAPRVAVTVVDQFTLDIVQPDWHSERRKRQQVRHVMLDEAAPRTFYVYPSNDGTGRLRAVMAVRFAPVVAAGAADALASYAAEVGVDDLYANALLDYVLYRAFSKDAQYAGSMQRAAAHFSQFGAAVNMQMGADASMSANRKPGVAGAAPGVAAGA